MKCLCVVLSLALLSCSSLSPVDSLPVSSPVESKCEMNEKQKNDLLRIIAGLKTELQSLRKILTMLKSSAGNLKPILEDFEARLKSLNDTNEKLKQELTQASGALTGLTLELENLKKDFADYREAVAVNRIRNGLIIGGACTLGGFIAGLLIGLFAK